jgi:hypothetical protein
MREMVEKIHAYMWAFCQKAELDIDPVLLKRSIGQQVSGALTVVAPESLNRLGHVRLAVMIDVANRNEVTLAELLHESLTNGADNSATLARNLRSRKQGTVRLQRRAKLRLVK